jgi:hypothetical protein
MESNPLVHFSKTMCAQHNALQILGKYSLENSVRKYIPSQRGLEFKARNMGKIFPLVRSKNLSPEN